MILFGCVISVIHGGMPGELFLEGSSPSPLFELQVFLVFAEALSYYILPTVFTYLLCTMLCDVLCSVYYVTCIVLCDVI